VISLSLACASRGFHEYRKIWNPRINLHLVVKRQPGNIFDPYAIGLSIKIRGNIKPLSLVGHLPPEISRFCKFFINGGNMKATGRDFKFHLSPLPQGSLEIPISLAVMQNKASLGIYSKKQAFLPEYYVEP
jgi:hypothetical protein